MYWPNASQWMRAAVNPDRLAPLFIAALLQTWVASPAYAAPQECVILLHGLARTAYSMTQLEQTLAGEGFIVANINYPSREYPIETLAEDAVNRGLADCREHQAGSIHFVTHSMGGILVRYYLSHYEIPELGRVVMLGPPNQGSEVVDQFADVPGFSTFNGPAGSQLGTGPDSLPNRLGAVDFPVGVIAGTGSFNPILSATLPDLDDGKVSVERTRVDGMTDFITVDTTHSFIMRNAEVIRQVLQFLRQGGFAHAAPIHTHHEEDRTATGRD
jgi:triacylglycerol lipase